MRHLSPLALLLLLGAFLSSCLAPRAAPDWVPGSSWMEAVLLFDS